MKPSYILSAGLLVAVAGLVRAAPPAIVSVRQSLPPELAQQRRAGLLPPGGRGAGGPAAAVSYPVACYEKLELIIDLQATFQNPYDPDQIDLSTEFTAPSGKVWKIWGFYNQTSTSALWMVRFAPNEAGRWRYVVKVKDTQGTAESKPAEFPATESKHPGFIGIAANKRYLQFNNGSPFYGVGLWYNDSYERSDSGGITEENLDGLKQHGVNFISFFNTRLETMGTGLGRYDQDRSRRLDEIFDWCEKRDILISWDIWFHSHFSQEVWGNGNTWYSANPYRLVASADQYFASEDAWKYTLKLYRYQVARWGYSRALALWFVDDEINGTEGWTKGGSQKAEEWCQKVHNWLKANDPYNRPTTGTRSGSLSEWWPNGYKIYDIAAREIYETQGHPYPKNAKPDFINDNPLKYSYMNYATQTQNLWSGFEKPAIIGETGAGSTYYPPGSPGYLSLYHNALWAGLANGLCMTPFWWSYGASINESVVTRNLNYFGRFVGDIDFTKGPWKAVTLQVSTGNGWAVESPAMTFGWVVNPMSGVGKETVTIPGLENGDYDIYLYRTWSGNYLEAIPATSTGGALTLSLPDLTGAQNLHEDVAFKLVRKGMPIAPPRSERP
jgi:hypothetical protein